MNGSGFAVFNAERFKRYALLVAYQVRDAAEAAIERLDDDGKAKAKARPIRR